MVLLCERMIGRKLAWIDQYKYCNAFIGFEALQPIEGIQAVRAG